MVAMGVNRNFMRRGKTKMIGTRSGATRNLRWRVLKFSGHHSTFPSSPYLPSLHSLCVRRSPPWPRKMWPLHPHSPSSGGSGVIPRGRDLVGTGGTVPQKKFEGDGPCIGPPNILRSSVVGCAWKYEQSEEWWFSCEEMVIYIRHLT